MKLIANSEQVLSTFTSRRLLTYEKVCEPTENSASVIDVFDDFRTKRFASGEETRQERRMRQAEKRELDRQEALKRDKINLENGKQIDVENKNSEPTTICE